MVQDNSAPELLLYVPEWEIHLKAERKSPSTLKSYLDGVRLYARHCEHEGIEPAFDRASVKAFVAHLLATGAQPATARARLFGVKRFSAWLDAEEIEGHVDTLAAIKPPKLDESVTPGLTDEECRAMIAACKGKDLVDLRDEAMLRLMFEGIVRVGEVLDMDLDDLDQSQMLATVRRGKGGKGRIVPYGPQTAQAIARYLRLRRKHLLAETSSALWLAGRRRSTNPRRGAQDARLTYSGARKALGLRAKAAGIENWHPHLTRHTGAQNWLGAGGSEGGLMAVAGWSSHAMLRRYTKATAAKRAAEEARKLGLGDW